jgi:branched-chain amino acid transport system substrate-binding protein
MKKQFARRKFWVGLILSTVMLIGTACSSSTKSDGAGNKVGTIKIGMSSALTGPYNEYGEGNKRGVERGDQRKENRAGSSR